MHVAGVLVRTKPSNTDQVSKQINALEDVEVEVSTEDGRLIVSILGENRKQVGDTLMALDKVTGVLVSTMVYEESDQDDQEGTV